MTRETLLQELNKIFIDVFDDDTIRLTEQTTADDIDDWDSLEQINLIIAIEKKYHVKFNMQEISELSNVGEMIDYIERKLL